MAVHIVRCLYSSPSTAAFISRWMSVPCLISAFVFWQTFYTVLQGNQDSDDDVTVQILHISVHSKKNLQCLPWLVRSLKEFLCLVPHALLSWRPTPHLTAPLTALSTSVTKGRWVKCQGHFPAMAFISLIPLYRLRNWGSRAGNGLSECQVMYKQEKSEPQPYCQAFTVKLLPAMRFQKLRRKGLPQRSALSPGESW